MGKWTPDYVDDVLHSKIKNLVSGAINRSSLEKTEPTISYENFVNDLDTGDSFTTSLIDILVKELAERRTRPTLNDRRLIADRSAKSLRLLATPLRVYRDRSMGRYHPSRRSTNLSEYLSAPPIEMDMEEDEDIFERMLDNGTSVEGARINTDLYEAYGTHVVPSSSRVFSPSPPAEDARSPLSPHPQPRSGPWSMSNYIPIPTATTTTLSRQPSIRRPVRSRTVDFNDFTTRRRSSTRDNQSSRAEPVETSEQRDGAWTRNSQATRRFFPFVRTRRHESADSYWGSNIPGATVSHGTDTEDSHYQHMPEPPNAPWFNLTPPLDREQSTMDEVLADAALSDERAQSTAPRLRRGGLRAPESIIYRPPSPVSGPRAPADEPPSGRQEASEHGLSEETGYPTPGSTEPDFLS